ncbi:MAG TPA: arginine deiminase-related protein [Spirochaetales bacterium]|nr:arginine deiminase-related protein [Spirochaetales bacterium]
MGDANGAMFTKAIVRRPGRSVAGGITAHPELGRPDYETALRQHDAYVAALERCGLSVEVLPALEEFPDSCFVEDVAVCAPDLAVVAAPAAPSRAGETGGVAELLARHCARVERIEAPGTLEGGDVMMVGKIFYVGLSARTNRAGFSRFAALLESAGYGAIAVPMPPTLHLKTGLSYLEDGWLLVDSGFAAHEEFRDFRRIMVDPSERYAANCVRVNARVLVPAGYPKTLAAIRAAGLDPIELEMSEFRKIDGGLSCLSLRF